MASYFEEERFFLGKKSNRMVTVTPFMGKVNVNILQFYVNGNDEMKPGKSGITLELNEFDKLVKLILQIESSIKRYELKDIGVSTTPLELDLPVFDLDKLECIDDVASVESIKEVERKLWLTHYYMLREKLMEVLRERCTGCQAYETNFRHELCALLSAEEQVNRCFEEVYARASWEDVMDCWYKKVLEMPIVLNPETLAVFRESLNPKDVTYKNRLKKMDD